MPSVKVEYAALTDRASEGICRDCGMPRTLTQAGICEPCIHFAPGRNRRTDQEHRSAGRTPDERLAGLQSRRNGPESALERVVGLWANRTSSGGDPRRALLGLRARRIAAGW
jgi:hypothetical protein